MKLNKLVLQWRHVWILLAITGGLYIVDELLSLANIQFVQPAAHLCLAIFSLLLLYKLAAWPAYLTAILYALVFPHASFGFFAFFCLTPVLAAVLEGDRRKAMWLAWLAGNLANIGKLYWLVYTISYFSPIPFPAAVLILVLLTSTLGLFWSLHFGLVHWLVRDHKLPLWLVFPAGWVFWDWFLTWFLGGFPWELLGCGAFHIPLLNQTFDLVGEHGLGWLMAFGSVVFYELWLFVRRKQSFPALKTAVLVALIAAGMIYGAVRINQIDKLAAAGEKITVGLLQGNVDQSIKWKPEHRVRILDKYARITRRLVGKGAELIIFPETAIARRQDRWKRMHPEIARYAEESGQWVLAGVVSKKRRPNPYSMKGRYLNHNSAVLLTPKGKAKAWYDKNRLVPFGEFIPKKHWIEAAGRLVGIEKIKGTLNFEISDKYRTMPFPKAPFAVFICYEAVYPSVVRCLSNLGAKFLVTITNDAWFGDTSAPFQHWDQVAMRAIENRRYVARAANTGITGIIDPVGRTIKATAIYQEAEMIGEVRTLDIQTIYAKIGDAAAYAATAIYACAILVVLAIGLRRRRDRETT